MGDYANVQILFAESDFDPEEREFLAVLWDRYFEPERRIGWKDPGAYEKRESLRERVHAELRLPGSEGNWRFVLTREIDGRRYYQPLGSLASTMIPPFPRRFARIPRLREKYGIKPTWYAMFPASAGQDDRWGFVLTVSAARKRFAENFSGLWRLIFSGCDETEFEALVKATPERSAARRRLERVFDRFPFVHYLETLELLAGDWGGHALVELSFAEILYNYDEDGEKATAMVRTECASASRVFSALARLDLSGLCDECILESQRLYGGAGLAPWLAPYEHEEPVRRFSRHFLTNPEEW